MFNKTKNNINKVSEFIPIAAMLGVITGFGVYTSIIGAFIASVIGLFFNNSFIYGLSISTALLFASCNVYLGGRSETLFALVFMTGVFLFVLSFVPKFFRVPKFISFGFISGCIFGVFLLLIPVIFGLKTFSSPHLMLASISRLFSDIDENSVIVAFSVIAFYYYLSRQKILPPVLTSVIGASFIAFLYKLNTVDILQGFENFKFVASADFGNFLFLSLFAFFVSSHIWYLLPDIKKKRTGVSLALSNMTSALFGTISGGIYSKKGSALAEAIILLIFLILFQPLGHYVPLPAVASALLIYCCRYFAFMLKSLKRKNIKFKLGFVILFLFASYNAIIGYILGLILIIGKYLCQRK